MRKVMLAYFLFFVFSTLSFADTVTLKSGRVVEGRILENTGDYVKVDMQGIELTYWAKDIESVQESPKEPPAPTEAVSITPDRRAYMAYMSALQQKDWEKMKKYMTKANIERTQGPDGTTPDLDSVMQFSRGNYRIGKEYNRTETSVALAIIGDTPNGKAREKVYLVVEDGKWKIDRETWKMGWTREAQLPGRQQ